MEMAKLLRGAAWCAFTYPGAVNWMRSGRHDHGVLTNAASLLICGLLAGVVVAAAAFPAVAMSGLAAKAGAETFDKLPTELTVPRSPQISYVYAADGKTQIALLYDENRKDVPLSEVSPTMQKAIVAAEDQNFYHHNGVDVKGIARAFVANQNSGETEQGASTLTMQYVRMAISYSARTPQEVVDATEDTNVRKLREIRYAMALEKKLNKQQILEKYLNMAPFGAGAYGVFAASHVYFSKGPKDLTIEEAALLAGLVKAPSAFDPTDPAKKPDALDRRNWVIDQMVKTGAITKAEGDTAKATDIKVVGKRAPNGCTSPLTAPKWGFFCDYLYRWWMDQETFGANTYERERRLKGGGYKIITSLDVKTQAAAQKNVNEIVNVNNPDALMVAAIEPGTGRVQALATNRNFKLDDPNKPQNKMSSNPAKRNAGIRGSYPSTTNPLMTGGGEINGYQAGSTFKLFTMVAALENGYPLSYTIDAKSPYTSKFVVEEGGDASCGHFYCVENANPKWMNGTRNMWTGFGRSVNTYFVPLEERVGADKAVDVAKRLGIQFRAGLDANLASTKQNAAGWGAFTLGVSQTTPLELANAYATLAADGTYCSPTPVKEIVDTTNGNKLDVANPNCKQAISKDVARAALDAARCPVGDQSAFGKCDGATAPQVHGAVGKPVFGKTGTTDANRTAAMVAGTKQLVVGGILGDPDWAQTSRLQANVGGRDIHSQVVNPAVYKTLADAMKGQPGEEFPKPGDKAANGDQRSIPDVRCKSVADAQARLRGAGFDPVVNNTPEGSNCPAGTVSRTDPSGRTVKGGVVGIYISNGQASTPPPNQGGGNRRNPNPTLPCPPFCTQN
jgi:membrane peptidoglycan carboxypeptidase